MNLKHVIKQTLDNKLSFLGGAIIGIAIGLIQPSWGEPMGHVGDIFIDILKMCVMPIVIGSISLSIAHLLHRKITQRTNNIPLILLSIFLICSFIGTTSAILLQPGTNIDSSSSPHLKEVLDNSAQSTKSLDAPIELNLSSGFIELIFKAFPDNIFAALSTNNLLQIVVFSIIFGIALGRFSEHDAHIMYLTKQILEIFSNIFEEIIKFFPVILILLLAKEASVVGFDLIIAMGSFITKFYMAFIFLFILSTIVIKIRTKTSFYLTLKTMFNPNLIAFATRSSNASIPSSMNAMQSFNYDRSLIQLLIPLGSIIGRFGYILYFGFCTIFALQLYSIDLSLMDYILVIMITILAGISTTGQEEGTLALSSLAVVLAPIGIPIAGILPLLFAVDFFIDPFRTMTTVNTNCAALTLMGSPIKQNSSQHESDNSFLE